MTLGLLHADLGPPLGRRHDDLPRRAWRPSRHWIPGIVTLLGVSAGFGAVMTLAPRPETPGTVARAFVEARLDRDWSAMWRLHCRAGAVPGEAAFVDRMTERDWSTHLPSTAVVVVEDVVEDRGGVEPSFTVTLRVAVLSLDPETPTSSETLRLPVVGERGEFRVCLSPDETG